MLQTYLCIVLTELLDYTVIAICVIGRWILWLTECLVQRIGKMPYYVYTKCHIMFIVNFKSFVWQGTAYVVCV